MFGYMADAIRPGRELLILIKVVVTFFGRYERIIGEPRVIAASVKADVADSRRGALSGFHRAANHRLINVAEAHAPGVKHREKFFVIPGAVPDFDHERVIAEAI